MSSRLSLSTTVTEHGDVLQVKVPLPFPLRFVNSYLLPGPGGWTLIDPASGRKRPNCCGSRCSPNGGFVLTTSSESCSLIIIPTIMAWQDGFRNARAALPS